MCFFSISQDNFIKHLLAGTKNIDKQFALQSPETISHIINCSTAILLLSLKKCDISTNPNPTVSSKKQLYSIIHILSSQRLLQSGDVFFFCVCVCVFSLPFQSLFENVYEIFRQISVLLGSSTTEPIIFKHRTGTIYQNRFVIIIYGSTFFFSVFKGVVEHIPNVISLSLVLVNLLISTMQCWVQRRMMRSSNSPHFQPSNLSLETRKTSSLRSVCIIMMCFVHVGIFAVTWSLFDEAFLLHRCRHSQQIPIHQM